MNVLDDRRLARRAALIFAAFSAAAVAALQVIGSMHSSDLRQERTEVLVAAIEAGPVQFASRQSAAIASFTLEQLMTAANVSAPLFASVRIEGGEAFKQTFATWARDWRTAPACLTEVVRTFSPPGAFFPFRVTIDRDDCAGIASISSAKVRLIGALLIFVLGTAACLLLVAQPVITSLRRVRHVLDRLEDGQPTDELERSVRYAPLAVMVEQLKRIRSLERLAAIARTTQMVAHDVRKPFSMLKMLLNHLASTSGADAQSFAIRALPEVDRAMASVNGMLSDIMEIDSTAPPRREATGLEELLRASLVETFIVYPKADVVLSCELSITRKLEVDRLKLGRVLANVMVNAVQAMKKKGRLWLIAREVDGWCQLTIGNSGSHIPAEDIPRLFDAFFTKGKQGGTGLGLAIAQKTVTAHGGRIWATSSPEVGVEFHMTLPLSSEAATASADPLPRHSKDLAPTFARAAVPAPENRPPVGLGEPELERSLTQALEGARRALRVLVVDDEPVYRDGFTALASRMPEAVSKRIELIVASGPDEAAGALARVPIDLVVCDVDLGTDELSGYDLVRSLREFGCRGRICIHSNRALPEDYRQAMNAGADSLIPKPMSRVHLLRLLVEAAPRQAEPPPDNLVFLMQNEESRREWMREQEVRVAGRLPVWMASKLHADAEELGVSMWDALRIRLKQVLGRPRPVL